MTWNYEWNFSDKFSCRNRICHKPFYDGEFEPDVTIFATTWFQSF
jgi:hypothetical protein